MALPEQITFVGLGPQKCGTTWIGRHLSRHPDIFMTRECRLWVAGQGLVRERLGSRRAFAAYAGQAHAGTYQNGYISSPAVLSHIHADCPGAKFFVCFRDPIERTVSAIRHCIKRGRLSPGSLFAQMMEKAPIRHFCADMSMYDDLLTRCYACMGRSRVKVLIFEDIKQNPQSLLDELVRFIGADPQRMPAVDDQALSEPVNPGFTPRWPVAERAGRRIRRLEKRWHRRPDGGWAVKGAAALARRMATGIERVARDYQPREVIPPEAQQKLANLYLPGLRRVEEETGRDLTSLWTKTLAAANGAVPDHQGVDPPC
jgi:hypothetical protein